MNEREYYKNQHPATCTCVDCNRRRLKRQRQGFFSRLLTVFRRR